jgi:phenylpropionate dioxygenase-like ring-hydroxylating dioxygenase large terminal subunit
MMTDTQITGVQRGVTRYPRYDSAVLGFEGYWYPVMFARDLDEKPTALHLFGEDIMFIREGRNVYAWQDRCPHRGVKLSIGKKEFAGTFTCRYHGWTFDLKTGVLVAALTDGPDSPLCGKARVAIWPAAERAGLIWIYRGTDTPPPVEADIPEELLADNAVIGGRISIRPGDWRHGAENGFDEGHGKYLHRDSIFVLFRHPPAWIHSDVVAEPGGWITRSTKDYAFQSEYPGLGKWPKMSWWKTTKVLSRASIRLPGVLRIDFGEWTHFEWYVPTTQGHHRYLQFAVKQTSGVNRLLFRLRYWTYLRWLFHRRFNDQDARVVEMMQTPPEQLYRPDNSIIAWRKLCEQARRPGSAARPEPLVATLATQRPEEQPELTDMSGAKHD